MTGTIWLLRYAMTGSPAAARRRLTVVTRS